MGWEESSERTSVLNDYVAAILEMDCKEVSRLHPIAFLLFGDRAKNLGLLLKEQEPYNKHIVEWFYGPTDTGKTRLTLMNVLAYYLNLLKHYGGMVAWRPNVIIITCPWRFDSDHMYGARIDYNGNDIDALECVGQLERRIDVVKHFANLINTPPFPDVKRVARPDVEDDEFD
ncbi:hypothetical protein GEMRC1_011153 [Eukaryota sp. GEM-RC1]